MSRPDQPEGDSSSSQEKVCTVIEPLSRCLEARGARGAARGGFRALCGTLARAGAGLVPEYLVVCGQVATDAGVLAVGGVANGGPECSIELGGPCTALPAGAGIRHILS